jgi:hypothetical protein
MTSGRLVSAIFGVSICIFVQTAQALCYDRAKPTISAELKDSEAVVVGDVERINPVMASDAPDIVDHYVYSIKVAKVYKGQRQPLISIVSDN